MTLEEFNRIEVHTRLLLFYWDGPPPIPVFAVARHFNANGLLTIEALSEELTFFVFYIENSQASRVARWDPVRFARWIEATAKQPEPPKVRWATEEETTPIVKQIIAEYYDDFKRMTE
jgi:hypothetical protein